VRLSCMSEAFFAMLRKELMLTFNILNPPYCTQSSHPPSTETGSRRNNMKTIGNEKRSIGNEKQRMNGWHDKRKWTTHVRKQLIAMNRSRRRKRKDMANCVLHSDKQSWIRNELWELSQELTLSFITSLPFQPHAFTSSYILTYLNLR